MIVSRKGRSYDRGKAVGVELRKNVIDWIVKEGGDITTGNFPGSFTNVAKHVERVVRFQVVETMLRYGEYYSAVERWKQSGTLGTP